MSVLVEACVGSVDEAIAAARGGANRLELCDNLDVGGTTPSPALIRAVRAAVDLPIMVMIRPRGGSFVHSASELDQMRRDIDTALAHAADGIVFGVLDRHGRVDAPVVEALVRLSATTPVTFHKAFDVIDDQLAALDTLIASGVRRVLTSGGAVTALEGTSRIAALVERGAERIAVMAGGKVRGGNVRAIVDRTAVGEVHARSGTDETQIRAIVSALEPESCATQRVVPKA